jgi:hypothetical protein
LRSWSAFTCAGVGKDDEDDDDDLMMTSVGVDARVIMLFASALQ